ncbi:MULTISPECIES: hypothetical protein [Candidatus Kuenenia]|nr:MULTISPECIES: hypothetical protein [Kuenenia]MCZ7621634.1 hypothetical protein [Candidatus Kuenenia sp.]
MIFTLLLPYELSRNTARRGLRFARRFTSSSVMPLSKTGRQHIIIHKEHGFTLNRFFHHRQGQFNAPIEKHLEQQVFRPAVFLTK